MYQSQCPKAASGDAGFSCDGTNLFTEVALDGVTRSAGAFCDLHKPLTPLCHHRERNMVQRAAMQSKESGLDMLDLQTPANLCKP